MKKFLYCMMLAASITGTLFAQSQTTAADKTFGWSATYAQRRFVIDLGKGNKLQIELVNNDDLRLFANMDSVLRVFMTDIASLKDSLTDEIDSRRIDYTVDTAGRKKIRILHYAPKGSSFLVQQGDIAALKLEQDTINFMGTVNYYAKYTLRKGFRTSRRYRVSFFLNDLSDLSKYMDGSVNLHMQTLITHMNDTWINSGGWWTARLKADPAITSRRPRGGIADGNYINFRFSVDAQNYKAYFVPSFSLGGGLIIGNSFFKRDIIVSWDPNFLFARNGQGTLKTYRNDFVTLTWGQGMIQDNNPRLESHLLFIMSLGYLVNRQGEFLAKNTFRVGAGRLSVAGGKTKLEPAFYFNRFFKGVTPAFRWIQSF